MKLHSLKKARRFALAIGMLVGLSVSGTSVFAQVSGTTDIDISYPPLVILFYYSNVDITIQDTDLSAIVATANPLDQGTAAGTGFTPNLGISGSTTGFTNPSAVNLDLIEVWAVRAIGDSAGAGTVMVSLTLDDDTLTHVGGDTITINSLATQTTGAGSFAATTTFAAQGLGTAITGDVRLNLDLSNATVSGDYLDGAFTITATAL